MLKIKDKDGNVKYVLLDDEEKPLSIDELVIREAKKKEKKDAN